MIELISYCLNLTTLIFFGICIIFTSLLYLSQLYNILGYIICFFMNKKFEPIRLISDIYSNHKDKLASLMIAVFILVSMISLWYLFVDNKMFA